jgi:hypothetical protein
VTHDDLATTLRRSPSIGGRRDEAWLPMPTRRRRGPTAWSCVPSNDCAGALGEPWTWQEDSTRALLSSVLIRRAPHRGWSLRMRQISTSGLTSICPGDPQARFERGSGLRTQLRTAV